MLFDFAQTRVRASSQRKCNHRPMRHPGMLAMYVHGHVAKLRRKVGSNSSWESVELISQLVTHSAGSRSKQANNVFSILLARPKECRSINIIHKKIAFYWNFPHLKLEGNQWVFRKSSSSGGKEKEKGNGLEWNGRINMLLSVDTEYELNNGVWGRSKKYYSPLFEGA